MNHDLTAITIKNLRENKQMTQEQLGEILSVSAKTISKWETGRGLPDVSLLAPLASALDISVTELLSGECATNRNVSGNMLKTKFYVCPVCGNIIHALGDVVVSCCGITLPALEPEQEGDHAVCIERIEDEHFVSSEHSMTKQHYLSFFAYVTSEKVELVKLYPEGSAETRFFMRGGGYIYWYCNHHGLFRKRI